MAQATTSKISNKEVKETGKGWEKWFAVLDQAGARSMSHEEIARFLAEPSRVADPMQCQWVTIAYEKHIGRRVTGQDCYGNFYATASKAVAGDLDFALNAWLRLVNDANEFNGIALAQEPKVSSSEKFRYWRSTFADGGTINVVISMKSADKSTVAVDHRKLADLDAVAEWKEYWKSFLAGL